MFDHPRFFAGKIAELKREGRYRVFAELERTAGAFPRARNHCRPDERRGGKACRSRVPP